MKKAFTLIELLIVIGIIGIMSGFLFSVINIPEWRKRAQDTVRKEDVATLAGAFERYYSVNNSYPVSASSYAAITETNLIDDYIRTVPTDPVSGSYMFKNMTNNQDFCICTTLQASNAVEKLNGCTDLVANSVAGGNPGQRDYCMTNPF